MKLSTKGRYGVRFMLDLAQHAGGRNVTLKEVSQRQNISEKYLWQVIVPLRRHGLVRAVVGSRGGYALARDAHSITMLDILSVLEGGAELHDGLTAEGLYERVDRCAVVEMWAEVNREIAKALSAFTLASIAARQKRLDEASAVNYSI